MKPTEKELWTKRGTRWSRFKARFFKWGIVLSDRKYPYYGGHTHWLSNLFNVDGITIGPCKWRTGKEVFYYEGQHNTRYFGFFYIYWML